MTIQNLDFGTAASNDGESLFAAFTKIEANFVDLYAGGGTVTHAVTDVASAATCDIGAAATDRVRITGTTTITSLGTVVSRLRFVHFAAALTLTYNATSLILPGALSITTAAGDAALFSSDASGNWRCLAYVRADGHPLIALQATIASAATTDLGSTTAQNITVSGTTTITSFGSSAPTGALKSVHFSGALTLTYNATSFILPGAGNIVTVAGDCGLFRHEGSGNWRCVSWQDTTGVGNVTGPGSATDNAAARWDATTGELLQNSSLIIGDTADLTAYDATNDGNPVFAYGASAAERLTVTPTYDAGAQTLDYVLFQTDLASATADKGLFRFAPDGTAVLDIDDGGINFAASKGISIAGTDILTDAAGTATLSNIDALDATTEATIEAAVDTLANLVSIQGRTVTLADAGANAFFGWDDGAGAYENLTATEALAIIMTVDGSGSGLDADLLDGKNIGTSGNVVPLLDGANAFSALQTFSLAGNAARFVNTTDGASVQVARFEGDRATMAADDEAYLSLLLSDSAGNQDEFARITWRGTTVTAAAEAGRLAISLMTGGSLAEEIYLTGTALSPAASDGNALGTASLMWADLFLAAGGVINFNSGNVTITHSADQINFAGSGATTFLFKGTLGPVADDGTALGTTSLKFSDLFLASGAVVNFNSGDVTITHAPDLLTFAGAVSGYVFSHVIYPSADDGAALGTAAVRWSDLFLASGGVVNFNAGDITATHSAQQLTFSSSGSPSFVFKGAVLPLTSDGGALGSTSLMWSDVFFAAGGVINFNNGDVTLTHSANFLTFAGATTGYAFDATVGAHTATAIPAGGTAGAGFGFSSTANFGVYFGSGAPTLSAAKGSLYLRSDGTGTGDRAYINTNGSTTWTALTTAA